MDTQLARKLVTEALALRASQPHAPVRDVLDLVIRDRDVWLEDLLDHMEPPSPFSLLVAEAVGDCMSSTEWRAFTGPQADERLREVMQREYRESVWPKFVERYGLLYPSPEHLR